MKSTTSRTLGVALALLATIGAGQAQAYRMIQNTNPGRTSSGYLVACDDPGGFTHWSTSAIAWRHNPSLQGGKAGVALALQRAMASWTAVAGASHALIPAGTSTAGFVTDGVNVLRWATGEGCSNSCLALTALVLESGQVI